uniref:Orf159 n=1 Tax=Brassica napus TaxID=3708 RepID=Q33986_BRANA|nr:unnamed protein product [Brassica napus]
MRTQIKVACVLGYHGVSAPLHPHVEGRIIWTLLEHYTPKDPILPPLLSVETSS